ncbi:hypothetical protein ACRQ5Q_15185 [Bradyrhizobium sp. PMVTL-01]|uniref:hypothetical protein n=1 Tax=Bradyrhizobium sp. PMVTL-01 TaxID=3434999 RepID=UPI003F6F4C8D
MTISSKISDALASLQSQVGAANPLNKASSATIAALKLNAAQLVDDVQTELVAKSLLDTWVAPSDAQSITSGFLDVLTAAEDQSTLSYLRGVTGRVASNLDQLQ